MKFSILFRLFTAIAFLWLLTTSTAAQGAGFDTYTWIDYDEETNTVTAYSQTDVDYELAGDYKPRVTLKFVLQALSSQAAVIMALRE